MSVDSPEPALTAVKRLRRSRALVITFEKQYAVCRNFLSKRAFRASHNVIGMLCELEDWRRLESAIELAQIYGFVNGHQTIHDLVNTGALVEEGTEAALQDEDYETHWSWGAYAAYYHFSIRNEDFATPTSFAEHVNPRVSENAPPQRTLSNERLEPVISLPQPDLADPVLSTMLARRSQRTFDQAPIELSELAACLYSGLGIVAHFQNRLVDWGRQVLKPTPSAGAQNPFEGYVYANNVAGLARSVYHYSGEEHSLGTVNTHPSSLEDIAGSQNWVAKAGAVIFLNANLERTMYKYEHPQGYRAVLIEAGHIAQNILVMATRLGLATSVTAALNDRLAEESLGLNSSAQFVPYAIVLGKRNEATSQNLPTPTPGHSFQIDMDAFASPPESL